MNNKNNLNLIADELRQNCDDRFSLAMLTLVEALEDVGDDEISTSYGNIGIRVLNDYIEFVDIEAGKSLLAFQRCPNDEPLDTKNDPELSAEIAKLQTRLDNIR